MRVFRRALASLPHRIHRRGRPSDVRAPNDEKMSEIKNRDRILEAIDQLRRRKARPDANRICNFLVRRFSVNAGEARTDLQRCVDERSVLRVEYKGNISYRNAARKYSHLKRDAEGRVIRTPNRKFADLLTNAIAELIVQEPDYLELGVPEPDLIGNILSKDNVKYTRKYVSILLEKQVECGGLIRMDNGHYLMGPSGSGGTEEGGKEATKEKQQVRRTVYFS